MESDQEQTPSQPEHDVTEQAPSAPSEAVHGSLEEIQACFASINNLTVQVDTLSANLQSEMVARQALESRLAALESRFSAPAVPPEGATRAN